MIRDQSISAGPPTRTVLDVSWPSSPPEWATLNSDESVIPETVRAPAGGLFCDTDGCCLGTYNMNLLICSITMAELRAVVTG